MKTWSGKFKPVAGFGQTLGPNGTTVDPQSSSVDKVLGHAPSRQGTDRFLWDYGNKGTDSFLQRIAGGQVQGVQDAITGGAVNALTGLNPQLARQLMAQRQSLRQGSARAFIGPDGSFSYRDLANQGDREAAVPAGATRLSGVGNYDPVAEALASDNQGYRDVQASARRAGIDWQAPLWLSLSRSMGGGTIPRTAWSNS